MFKRLLWFLPLAFLFTACDDDVLTDEEECIKTVVDTYENANNYSHISLTEYSAANISLDSFKNTSTVRIYVESVCYNENVIAEIEYKIENGIECDMNNVKSCEEYLAERKERLESQQETLDRKIASYTQQNYVIVHEFYRYGLVNKQRYFLNERFEIIARDYLIEQGLPILWSPRRCDEDLVNGE